MMIRVDPEAVFLLAIFETSVLDVVTIDFVLAVLRRTFFNKMVSFALWVSCT